ncbi:MAG: ribbon-helix-helix protein, CopG family [Chloroflexi bacterium]|nr:ribbon-helix-helix protein, CopG family [Chloroflexota bacterium]
MRRTQVYLGEEELKLLDRVARATGASQSELIRRAVRRTFGKRSRAENLAALAATAFVLEADLLTTNVRHLPMFPALRPAYWIRVSPPPRVV